MEIIPKIYISSFDDPFINLSLENQLLLNISPNERLLFFYKNRDSVILGRFQNPWLECNLKLIQKKGIHLVRRQSGGGCVFHDKGNLNFSFIYPEKDFHKDLNNSFIIKALNRFSITAYASGRSDLLVDKDGVKKFSGSAFKQKKDRSFHHGTLLINSNLEALNNYLKPRLSEVLDSKSIKSNPAIVKNLSQLNSLISQDSLIEAVQKEFEIYYDTKAMIIHLNNFSPCDYYHFLTDWNWRWGETPLFKVKFEDFDISIKKGMFLEINDIEIQERLVGEILTLSNLKNIQSKTDHEQTLKVIQYLLDLVTE